MSSTHERNDQVNVVVTEDQKSRWQDYLEHHGAEFQSPSQLIRRAVEKEVSNEPSDDPDSAATNLDTSEVLEAIGRVDEKLREFEPRLANIERAVRHDPEVRTVANRLFEHLPTKDELFDYLQLVAETGAQPPEQVSPRNHSGRIEDLAVSLDEPQHRIREGLDRLQRDMHLVHSLERDGETRYYREDCACTNRFNGTSTASRR